MLVLLWIVVGIGSALAADYIVHPTPARTPSRYLVLAALVGGSAGAYLPDLIEIDNYRRGELGARSLLIAFVCAGTVLLLYKAALTRGR